MEWIQNMLKSIEPVQIAYGVIAIVGGMARYLNNYTQGQQFGIRMFLASAFVSGFSGWMFAVMGMSLHMPQGIVFMMAGTGGFFGDQTMKLIMDYLEDRVRVNKV